MSLSTANNAQSDAKMAGHVSARAPRTPARGGGGERGGRSKPGTTRIGGMDVPVDEDLTPTPVEAAIKPGELFPPRAITKPKPATQEEKACISLYLSFRDRIHEGPLYTVSSTEQSIKKPHSSSSNDLEKETIISDPFENGIETYHKKYQPRKRTLPDFKGGSYELRYFPRELWSVLDPKAGKAAAKEIIKRRKLGGDPARKKTRLLQTADAEEAEDGEDAAAGGTGVDGEGNVEEDEAEAELQDDNFEEDEDEMAGDYNAEAYFSDGGDDAGEDYDGGDGGGDRDMDY